MVEEIPHARLEVRVPLEDVELGIEEGLHGWRREVSFCCCCCCCCWRIVLNNKYESTPSTVRDREGFRVRVQLAYGSKKNHQTYLSLLKRRSPRPEVCHFLGKVVRFGWNLESPRLVTKSDEEDEPGIEETDKTTGRLERMRQLL
jgi:hypothetical protein